MSDSKHPAQKSFCSDHLMYFVNEYHREDYSSDDYPKSSELSAVLDRFHNKCIYGPFTELSHYDESPIFAHHVQNMINSYNWYITNRYWGFQLLYPVVSFLQVFYSIILTTTDTVFYGDILSTYLDSIEREAL